MQCVVDNKKKLTKKVILLKFIVNMQLRINTTLFSKSFILVLTKKL